jgi:citrate lyase subunit beta/citryl-CoA lyase
MVPKVGSAEEIQRVKRELSGQMQIIPLIETAKGVYFAHEIASADLSVVRLAFGAVDYSLDLGISISYEQQELMYPRSQLAVASRAAGIEPPIDTVFVDLDHEEGLIREARVAKRLGFRGKLVIHPKQIQPVHAVFSPTKEELEWAQRIVEAFEEAEKKGVAAISVQGKMVDYPVYKQALTILQLQPNT